jgi:hypothetical protein
MLRNRGLPRQCSNDIGVAPKVLVKSQPYAFDLAMPEGKLVDKAVALLPDAREK